MPAEQQAGGAMPGQPEQEPGMPEMVLPPQQPPAAAAAGAPAEVGELAAAGEAAADVLEGGEEEAAAEGVAQEEGPVGPDSLHRLVEKQVLQGIYRASRQLGSAFCVGGSLGRLPVALAVQRPGTEQAAVLRFPEDGSKALSMLREACVPAVFGRGQEEVLDDSYRRALAAPPGRIFLQDDPAQHPGLLAAVRQLLLPDKGPVRAQLHGLNVYSETGFFRPHCDTPRGDPHFVGSLVVCLPVGHAGGGLRVEHSGHSTVYEWGGGAAEGEVQWAAFYSDCLHEVLPVTAGARVTLAYELFAQPANDATEAAAGPTAISQNGSKLLHAFIAALESNSFMVNGGSVGFACQHAYPSSLVQGINAQAVQSMLKGEDAALLHVLLALHLPFKIVRVWQQEWPDYIDYGSEDEPEYSGLPIMVGELLPGRLTDPGEDDYHYDVDGPSYLEECHQARFDDSIMWLGGEEAFPEWTLGAVDRFYYGNYPVARGEFYCSLGIVVEVPPYVDRREAGRLAWAGGPGARLAAGGRQPTAEGAGGDMPAVGAPRSGGSPGASPQHKRAKQG